MLSLARSRILSQRKGNMESELGLYVFLVRESIHEGFPVKIKCRKIIKSSGGQG